MNLLISSSLDECLQHMGEPHLSVDIKDMAEADIKRLEQEISAAAKKRGYRNLVLKTEEENLYVF